MRRRSNLLRPLALAAILAVPPLACVDLFHSTSFETACDVDAAACATPPALPDGGPTDFCQWDTATAQSNSLRACGWLGACAGPIGDNALGPCFVRAMLAYDCAVNPNRALVPGTAAHDFWNRLWQATSCSDVTRASFPPKVAPACGASPAPFESCFLDSGTILSCSGDDSGTTLGFEDCTALGQTCATTGALAVCAGSPAACAGAGTSCSGTQLHDCDPDAGQFDLGVDCASVGAGKCVPGSPSACQAASDAGCTSTTDVVCNDDDTASGCPSGAREQIDCRALLLGKGSCDSTAAGRPWDVSRACTSGLPCTGQDSCGVAASFSINSCARGVAVSVSCTAIGLSGCKTVQLPNDPTVHAVCVP
jgi:hypothetical protein